MKKQVQICKTSIFFKPPKMDDLNQAFNGATRKEYIK